MKGPHGGDIWKASLSSGIRPVDLIDFSSSINPLGPPKAAKAGFRKSLCFAGSYPDPEVRGLKNALSGFHKIPAKNILPANGSTELIYLLPRVLKPKNALIVGPAFSEYRRSLKLSGCKVFEFILKEKNGFLLDENALIGRLKHRHYGLLYIGNPSNPLGALLEKDLLIRLADVCRDRKTVLVVDEAFIDFSERYSLKKEAVKSRNIIVLRSMTKFFAMAGLRLGYMVAESGMIKRFSLKLQPWTVNTPAAMTAIGALSDREYVKKTLKWLDREKTFLAKGIEAIGGLKPYHSDANYMTVKITSAGLDALRLYKALLKKGILIRPLLDFTGLNKRFFRIAIKKRRENRMLIRRLKRLCD
ncbi:MAG: threonine-phosphate decarboxylase [Deltaproteobacteria bacterium]|nr:threonine-phosphate decarboxylase [Deltaproteobacteria bacterium]